MPKVSYGRLIRVGLVGPKPRTKVVGDGQLVSIPAPLEGRFKAKGVTQEGRRSVPIGHGASLARRRLGRGKSLPRLSGGVGASGDVSQSEFAEPTLARKASLLAPLVPVPQTASGGRG